MNPWKKLLSKVFKKHAEEGKCDSILVKDRHEVTYYLSKCIYKTTLNTKLLFPLYAEDLGNFYMLFGLRSNDEGFLS